LGKKKADGDKLFPGGYQEVGNLSEISEEMGYKQKRKLAKRRAGGFERRREGDLTTDRV